MESDAYKLWVYHNDNEGYIWAITDEADPEDIELLVGNEYSSENNALRAFNELKKIDLIVVPMRYGKKYRIEILSKSAGVVLGCTQLVPAKWLGDTWHSVVKCLTSFDITNFPLAEIAHD